MSVTHPAGFRAGGVAAGLKSSGGLDLALVVNDGPSSASASVFTANRCIANPVIWSKEVVKDGVVRAVVLNSGGANCYTGPDGFQTTHAVAEQVAQGLGIGAGDVVVCSTGLIGLTNPRENLLAGVDAVLPRLDADGGDEAAHAIMTTDHVSKQVVVEGATDTGGSWSIGGMAKGAGHARAPAGHDAGRADHRCRRRRRDLRPCAAHGDPGHLRPARLRRLHVHQRHRHPAGQWRLRREAVVRGVLRSVGPGLLRAGDAAPRRRRGLRPRDRDHHRQRRQRGRRGRRRPVGGAQQPVQGRRVRQGPELGPGAGQHRHHGRGVRPR